MIRVTWFCRRCGKEIKTEDLILLDPREHCEELCDECKKEYDKLRAKQRDELDRFWWKDGRP